MSLKPQKKMGRSCRVLVFWRLRNLDMFFWGKVGCVQKHLQISKFGRVFFMFFSVSIFDFHHPELFKQSAYLFHLVNTLLAVLDEDMSRKVPPFYAKFRVLAFLESPKQFCLWEKAGKSKILSSLHTSQWFFANQHQGWTLPYSHVTWFVLMVTWPWVRVPSVEDMFKWRCGTRVNSNNDSRKKGWEKQGYLKIFIYTYSFCLFF